MGTSDHDRLGELLNGDDPAAIAAHLGGCLGSLLEDAAEEYARIGDPARGRAVTEALRRCERFGEVDRAAAAAVVGVSRRECFAETELPTGLTRAALRGVAELAGPAERIAVLDELAEWHAQEEWWIPAAEVQARLVAEARELADPSTLLDALAGSVELVSLAVPEAAPEEVKGFQRRLTDDARELLDLCERAAEDGLLPIPRLVAEASTAASFLDRTDDRVRAIGHSARVLAFQRRHLPPDTARRLATWTTAVRLHLGRLDAAHRRDEALAVSQRLLHDYEALLPGGEVDVRAAAVAYRRHAERVAGAGFRHTALAFAERAAALAENAPVGTLIAVLADHVGLLRAVPDPTSALAVSHRVIALCEANPGRGDVPEREQIDAWSRHAHILTGLGEREAAVEAACRAVELAETAHERNTRGSGLVEALPMLIDRLHDAERDDEAVGYARRAVEVAEEAATTGTVPTFAVAFALDKLVTQLLHADHAQEALDASDDEIAAWTEVLATDGEGDADRARFAHALTNRSIALNRLRRHAEALLATERSVAVYDDLVEEHPHLRADLANTLIGGHHALRQLGRNLDALICCRRAADIYQDLGRDDPDHDRLARIGAYQALASLLAEERKEAEALDYLASAADDVEELVAEDPGRHAETLMGTYTAEVVCLDRLGRSRREQLGPSERAVAAAERLAELRPGTAPVERAFALTNHALCLGGVGREREAVVYVARAVAIYEELDDDIRGHHLDAFAYHLDRYACALSDIGGFAEALEQSERAQAVFGVLLTVDRESHLPEVASARSNHASRLEGVGRIDDAIACSEEALAMFEEFAGTESARHRPFANALSNYAHRLTLADRAEDALAPAERALRLREGLAGFGEPAFVRDVAESLLNLGHTLDHNGDHDDAVATTRRAVATIEGLAAADFDVHIELLAKAVHNLAVHLHRVSGHEEAIGHALRAVELRETLAGREPGLFLPALADSLDAYVQQLDRTGRGAEAVDAAARRVEVLALVAESDTARSADLASAREFHAYTLRLADRLPEAEAVIAEAVRAWYAAADQDPEKRAETEAAAAGWQAGFHDNIGDLPRAAAFAAEALERTRRLVEDGRDDLRWKLARRCNTFAERSVFAGNRLAAVPAAAEAVDIARALAADDPGAHRRLLRDSLSQLAWSLQNHGRADDGCAPGAEALAIAEELDDPAGNRLDLALALDNQAEYLAAAGRFDEAIVLADRALALWEELGEPVDLAWCLWHRAAWLAATGTGPGDTLPDSERAVALLRAENQADPYNRDDLAEALREHARHLHAAGDAEGAHVAVAESMEIREALNAVLPARHRPFLAEALLTAAALGAGDPAALASRAVALLGEAEDREPGLFTARLIEAERIRSAS
ncbi:tetratricopeptide repeat protein [Phytomonospora endophytica]|uniref:Tetratricopeptide (TPR) repeat protein n=1 Tax=Phytomonospora endophytica TaxID=714109 RepID=A0A841FVG0_9ACTN|nr:tetratricopeptide repeat protein [Phytomonospora endophytica]MBB6038753.1 tetratricopeptide (TPR) repeat protein [Phytomonospora endophytica]GIG68451.1 hypothetical protein Pen01_47460 [Phytomonospora endophytica]